MSITIGRLWSHPVKSMLGQPVDEVTLSSRGLVGDRAYGFLDVETGRLVSAKHPRKYGAMLTCSASFTATPQPDAAPPPVRVSFPDGSVVEADVGEIAKHASALLGREVRMVTEVEPGVPFEEVWPEMEGFGPDMLADALAIPGAEEDGQRVIGLSAGIAAPGTMLDFAPLHFLTTSTLRAMANEHPDGAWDERRFRPNLLIDDDSPAGELAEDAWLGSELLIGDQVRIHVVAPTPRCVMTTLAQGQGADALAHDSGILRTVARANNRTLGELGRFACAGAYAEVVTPGVIRVGDPVRVVERSTDVSPMGEAIAMLIKGLPGS